MTNRDQDRANINEMVDIFYGENHWRDIGYNIYRNGSEYRRMITELLEEYDVGIVGDAMTKEDLSYVNTLLK